MSKNDCIDIDLDVPADDRYVLVFTAGTQRPAISRKG